MRFLISCSVLALLAGCTSIPEFSAQPSAVNGLLSFDDLIAHIECEIASSARAGAFGANSYAASISLSAEVTSTSGVSPSLTYINPLSAATERSLGASGQYSRANHKNLTKNFSIFLNRERADAVSEVCKAVAGRGIGGDLGLTEAIVLGSNENFLFRRDGDPKVQNNFVITVDFTITKGASGGPDWNLVHFKGPSDSAGSLINWTNVAKDTLILSFSRVELSSAAPEAMEEKRTETMRDAVKAAEDGLTRSLLERLVPGR